MQEHFDIIAWLAGLGSWFCSVMGLFLAIFLYDLNPLWITLSLPVPFATVAFLYFLRLKSLPKLARQLGDLDNNKRQEAFKQLIALGQSSVDIFLRVLEMPRKKVESANWNGFAASILAVEGLGRLKAKKAVRVLLRLLYSSEWEICEKVLWALGEIGDDSVVPILLPFLGSKFLHNEAENALRKLGASHPVELFKKALQRDKTAIEEIRKHPYRKAFIKGFIRALWGESIILIPNAAWALAELWAVEAIPALRAQVTRWLPTEIRQACQQALDKLEMISKLPRAVGATEIDTSTLPRPATATDMPVENLPKAANIDREDS